MKPNIFQITGEELPCGAFFAWLLQWADGECAQYDATLHAVAQDFVRLLLGEGPDYPIENVIVGNQSVELDDINIWAEINEQYFIILRGIESIENIDQNYSPLLMYSHYEGYDEIKPLNRCEYKEKVWLESKLIYLKTANKNSVAEDDCKDYKVMNPKQILSILGGENVKNERFRQFVGYRTALEDSQNSLARSEDLPLNQSIVEYFFPELSKHHFFYLVITVGR